MGSFVNTCKKNIFSFRICEFWKRHYQALSEYQYILRRRCCTYRMNFSRSFTSTNQINESSLVILRAFKLFTSWPRDTFIDVSGRKQDRHFTLFFSFNQGRSVTRDIWLFSLVILISHVWNLWSIVAKRFIDILYVFSIYQVLSIMNVLQITKRRRDVKIFFRNISQSVKHLPTIDFSW